MLLLYSLYPKESLPIIRIMIYFTFDRNRHINIQSTEDIWTKERCCWVRNCRWDITRNLYTSPSIITIAISGWYLSDINCGQIILRLSFYTACRPPLWILYRQLRSDGALSKCHFRTDSQCISISGQGGLPQNVSDREKFLLRSWRRANWILWTVQSSYRVGDRRCQH
jgi:hypothetical protein